MTRFPLRNSYSMGFRNYISWAGTFMVAEFSFTLGMIIPHVFFQIQTKLKAVLLILTLGKRNG